MASAQREQLQAGVGALRIDGEAQAASGEAAGRMASGRKASATNEVWTVDFKGWWHDREGRCEPLTVRDEYSRYVLEVRALPNARARDGAGAF